MEELFHIEVIFISLFLSCQFPTMRNDRHLLYLTFSVSHLSVTSEVNTEDVTMVLVFSC